MTYREYAGILVASLIMAVPRPLWGQTDTESAAPVFEFDKTRVTEWLLIGPLPRKELPANPVELLQDPREGKEVEFPNGEKHRWQRFSADENGILRLGKFCQTKGKPSDHAVVYGALTLRSEHESRQFFLGADDGVRLWVRDKMAVDDARPGWMHAEQHRFNIGFSETTRTANTLFEFHNFTGDFAAVVTAGYRLNIKRCCADLRTPAPNSTLTVEIYNTTRQIMTDEYGEGKLLVPYETPVRFISGSGDSKTFNEEDFERLPGLRDDRKIIVSLQDTPPLQLIPRTNILPGGQFTAVAETTDGLVLLGNNADKTIYCYNGVRVYRHPNNKMHSFTRGKIDRIKLGPSGEIWISTWDDGVYCFAGDRKYHWDVETLGSLIQDLVIAPDGTAWIGACDDEFESNRIACLTLNNREPHFPDVDIRNQVVTGIAIFNQGIAVASATELLLFEEGVLVSQQKIPSTASFTGPSGPTMAQANDGWLWLAGQSLTRYHAEHGWQKLEWIDREINHSQNQQVTVGHDGSIWLMGDSILYRQFGKNHAFSSRIALPTSNAYNSNIVASRNGNLIVVGDSIGLVEVKPEGPLVYDRRDGAVATQGKAVSAGNGLIVVSSVNKRPAIKRPDDSLQEMPNSHSLHDFIVLCFPESNTMMAHHYLTSHERGMRTGVVDFPFHGKVESWSPLKVTWTELKNTPWESAFTFYSFCYQLSNGKTVIGTGNGLMEVAGNRLVSSDLLPDHTAIIDAMLESRPGEYWLAETGGDILHIVDGQISHCSFDNAETEVLITCLGALDDRIFAGTSNGLFELDPLTQQFRRFHDPGLANTEIVMFAKANKSENLWLATSKDGVFVISSNDNVARADITIGDNPPHITAIAIDSEDNLWISASEGTIKYEPTAISPIMFLDSVKVGGQPLEELHQKIDARWDQHVEFSLCGRDDSRSLTFQFRLNEQQWTTIASGTMSASLTMDFPDEGIHGIEFRCFDSEFAMSETIKIPVHSFIPFWERQWVKVSMFSLLGLLACGVLTLLAFNELTRNKAQEAAEQTAKERELLLARVSHDLRNPLTVVSLSAELLQMPDCDIQQVGRLLASSSESMTYLTDQLLTYAKSFNEEFSAPAAPTQVKTFLDGLQATVNFRFRNNVVEFRTERDETCPEVLNIQSEALAEILNNLIDNAFRHTSTGNVTVTYGRSNDGRLTFEVSDTGDGMDGETLQNLFKPFVRGRKPQTSSKSVGLGMSICERLAKKMSGTIYVESKAGVGSRIGLSLPANVGVPPTKGLEKATVSRRILIIDDELSVRESLASFVASCGHDVATSCDEKYDPVMNDFHPQLVIVDLAMPTCSGFDVARHVRERFGVEVQIVGMSGSQKLCDRALTETSFNQAFQKEQLVEQLSSLLNDTEQASFVVNS